MVSPLARQAIIDAVSTLCRAFDERDWTVMRDSLADTVATDYSRFRGTPPARLSAEEFVRLRQSGLAGLITQHLCCNHLVSLESETQALCRCDFIIHRWPEAAEDDRYFHTYGYYVYGLALGADERWRIGSITQYAVRSEGTPALHGAHRSTPLPGFDGRGENFLPLRVECGQDSIHENHRTIRQGARLRHAPASPPVPQGR